MVPTLSDFVLQDWMHDHQDLTLPALRTLAKTKDPPWTLGEKRIRRLRSMPCNAALVSAVADTCLARDALIPLIRVAFLNDVTSSKSLDSIAELLGNPEPVLLGSLYDRDPDAVSWYYEVYHIPDAKNTNHVLSKIFGKQVSGTALFIKNAPVGAALDRTVSRSHIVKMLWYYYISGIRPAQVASERTLERLIINL
ncbi:hypothetical protein C8R47DRAFT_1220855 [Mycena vitilis]|nr:hypothetical protein C8R47DRAFT_1220855 [Mycena vitilis]